MISMRRAVNDADWQEAVALLHDHIEWIAIDFASGRGCRDVWLETVRGPMDPAIALYRRNGFADAPARQATLACRGSS